jgi:uncharacterized membrane protein
MSHPQHHTFFGRFQRYVIAGIFTAIPIWITWLIFEFFVKQLSKVGKPWVNAMVTPFREQWPNLTRWIQEPWFHSLLAVIFTLVGLYLLGWIATRVIGRKAIAIFDRIVDQIPLVHRVYGATKQLITAIQQKPEGTDRVVLIDFPSAEMKAVGFVMRVLKDDRTGEELAAVYVPTTPNPTSGYLEIVPVNRLVPTDWTMDEAMTFIVSGGAVAPDNFRYRKDEADG